MKLSLVLVLALVCLAAAGPHSEDATGAPRDRPRRFIGWDSVDSFFHNVAAEVRRAWTASTKWAKHLFAWVRHHPEHSSVYRVRLPHGSGVVAIIDSRGPGGPRHHNGNALVWDGKRLAWEHAGHGSTGTKGTALDDTINLVHAHVNKTLPLSALGKYLSHVAAGSRIAVDIRGSSWHNLRVVLHVLGKHGEDKKKSVSVLLSTVLKQIEEQHSKSKSSKKSSSHAKKSSSSSSKLLWDGHDLLWANVNGQGRHVRRQLRVTKDGVSRVVPFSVLAQHLKTVPANSEISFRIVGHTLKDLRVLLNIHGEKKQTVSLLVSKLVQEAEASKHSASAGSANEAGKVTASVEARHHKKGKKKGSKPPATVQQV